MSEQDRPHHSEDDNFVSEPSGIAPWVITFADMVTLLTVFFILLFAVGTIEDKKWRQIKQSLSAALGSDDVSEAGLRKGLDVIGDSADQLDDKTVHAVDEVGAMVAKEIEEIVSEVEEFVFKNKLSGEVQVSSDERGAIITISDVVLFPPGQARMTLPGKRKLKQVFDLLKQFDYSVKIEGHTDNSPIRTDRFPSNWELSAARASEVVRMLIADGYPPRKIVGGRVRRVPAQSLQQQSGKSRHQSPYRNCLPAWQYPQTHGQYHQPQVDLPLIFSLKKILFISIG